MDGVATDEARVIDRWALSRFPFVPSTTGLEWPEDSQFAEVEARLDYLVQRPGATGLLSIDRGCGRRIVLDTIRTILRQQSRWAWWLDASAGDGGQLLRALIEQSGAPPVRSDDRLRRRVQDELSARNDVGRPMVVVVENLQRMAPDTAAELRWLATVGETAGLTLVFVTESPINQLVRDELADLVDLRMHVGPLTAAETDWYVRRRLAAAGASGELFDAESLHHVHQRTRGVLRRIDRLCRFALLTALAEEADTVTVAVIDRVAAEIGEAA